MSEEVQIDGKPYISSKRASEISGYAQDYIGQLSRKGLIDSRRIGGLWYVSMESLQAYQKKAEEFKPQPPAMHPEATEPSTLIFFDGKEYLSASKAAEQTGYTQDYVGQLARGGTILSHQVGNRWYVERNSILAHKKEKDALLAAVQAESVGLARPKIAAQGALKYPSNSSLSGPQPILNYIKEESDLLPIMKVHDEPIKLSESEIDTSVSNSLPIHKIYRVPNKLILPPKPKILLPTMVHKRSSSAAPLLIGAAATIIIVLSVGYASILRQNSVYATNIRNTSVTAMTADASSLASWIGNLLEPLLTRELIYQSSQN